MIGDPTGKSKTRSQLSLAETRKAGETYFAQVTKILDSKKTKIVYNSDWLAEMKFEEIIGLASKYTLARMLERDDFKNRYANNMPISLHELLYPLIQGYDSVAIKADIEVGGTDQTFNLLVGRTLQEYYGQKPQVVITYPLLAGLDGKNKMSKSLDNYIGLDEPADVMFEKCMQVPDELLMEYFCLTTDIKKEDVENLISSDIRLAHMEYAKTIVTMYHDAQSAESAMRRYKKVAKGSIPDDIKTVTTDLQSVPIISLIKLAGFAKSSGEARRHLEGRGIKVDGAVVEDIHLNVDIGAGKVIQFGKNRFVKIKNK
jgi:tyrosyl-tRNA synthetase